MKRKRAQQQQNQQYDQRFESNIINIDRRLQAKRKRVQIYPKNLSQETYLLKLNDPDKMIVFAIGPAGTGKTMLAVQWAIDQLKLGNADKIIITHQLYQSTNSMDFYPAI